MSRVAAIDCGTNSIRLLVADVTEAFDGQKELRDLHREMRIVRLGKGVDATGRLDPEALERTRVALVDYAVAARRKGAERVRMVATSATRDASNREDFFAMVRDTLGVEAEIISGDEEARLSFVGAVGDLDPTTGRSSSPTSAAGPPRSSWGAARRGRRGDRGEVGRHGVGAADRALPALGSAVGGRDRLRACGRRRGAGRGVRVGAGRDREDLGRGGRDDHLALRDRPGAARLRPRAGARLDADP